MSLLFPLDKGHGLSFEYIRILLSKNSWCQVTCICIWRLSSIIFIRSLLSALDTERHVFTQECFVPTLVKNGSVVLEKMFWKLSRYFHNIAFIFSLYRARPFIWMTLNPLVQECFMPSWPEIGPVVVEKKSKFERLRKQWQQRRRTDKCWSENLLWVLDELKALSTQESLAQGTQTLYWSIWLK